MTRFAVWRSLAHSVVPLDGVRATESETTEGRRDKRPRANWRYGVVVVDVFAHLAMGRSAAHIAYPLIFQHFHRATRFLRGQTP